SDRAADFVRVAERAAPVADFLTINVSSPNTERLRDLQGARALAALIDGVLRARDALGARPPVFVKIAPDLDDAALSDIAAVLRDSGADGAIATNTTLSRPDLASPQGDQAGGLSGAPLFDLSTRMLARLALRLDGRLPIIGVGGIASADQAWEKFRAGASAVQIYSGMIYHGISLAERIARDLDRRLASEGIGSIADLTGCGMDRWAAA
ncbi:MAG TPA: dihydroorotate dehydrogenase (quinone), partial [Paracoccus sp. (in: a-proteobacteria)]|nr:dihydroorotate dehydrogenase (quinone) [Paracoccus sp. (in: a-proteobacteria)]